MLYKYFGSYNEKGQKNFIDSVIKEYRIHLEDPNSYNDPFDGKMQQKFDEHFKLNKKNIATT